MQKISITTDLNNITGKIETENRRSQKKYDQFYDNLS